jgi:hypothetical protein
MCLFVILSYSNNHLCVSRKEVKFLSSSFAYIATLKIEFYKSCFCIRIRFINLNFVAGNLNLFPIFFQSSPNFLLFSFLLICCNLCSFHQILSFSFIKLSLRCARPLSGYELANSLTCVTPTKILLLLNHFKTFHRYAGVQCLLNGF